MIVNVMIGEEEHVEVVVSMAEMEVEEVEDLVVILVEIVVLETIILKTVNLEKDFESQDGI